ncbi:MAG: hypothetical protein DUW69_002646 [Verrucomicrobia bacterium]|nr:MAG: hypothetical protein DUW69_002646 [Verrucomicrobiota bacterium]
MDGRVAPCIFVLAVAQQMLGHQNCDNSWLFTAAERLLDGGRPYVDIIETNPPASFLIYLPWVWLARLLGLSSEFVVCAWVFAFGLAVILFSGAIMRRADLLKPEEAGLLLNLACVALVFMAGLSFAEREHLAALGVLPLLAVYAARMHGGRCRASDAIIAGLIAGLVVVLKPHFALAALCPLLAVMARTGSLRPAFRVENWVILSLCIGYLGLLVWRYPAFFTILPMLVDAYVAIKRPLSEIASEPWFLVNILIMGGVLAVGRRACLQALIALPLCASLGFMGAYLIQMKGFVNHGLPGVAMALLAAGALASPALADLRRRGGDASLWRSMRRAVLFGFFPALIGAPILFGAMLQFTDWEEHRDLLPAVQRLAPAQPRMMSITGQLDVGFPVVRRAGGVWVGRSHSLWLTVASLTLINAGVGDDAYRERLAAYVDLDARAFREDVRTGRPDLILVDDDARTIKAMAHPDIAAALADYAPRETVGEITLWMRKP